MRLLPFAALVFCSVLRLTAQAHIDQEPANKLPLLGAGVEFDPYSMRMVPERWKASLERLQWMRPGFLRVMSSATDYCAGFDAQGEPRYLFNDGEDHEQLSRLYEILDFAESHHIRVYLGEWSPPGSLGIRSPGDPLWPRIVADFVQHLVKVKKYSMVRNYILMNEPNGQWMWKASSPDFDAWSSGVKALRAEFDRRGLADVMIAGPDNSGGDEWFARSTRELHATIGAWEQHIYAEQKDILAGELETKLRRDSVVLDRNDTMAAGKPRFIAESGIVTGKIEELDQQPRVKDFDYAILMADYAVQIARAGWLGSDAWDLDDAMHSNGKGGKKIWGFWDSSSNETFVPRPWFYSWSLLSRAMTAGAIAYRLESNPAVRSVAIRTGSKAKPKWNLVFVNDTNETQQVALPKTGQTQWFEYRFDRSARLTGTYRDVIRPSQVRSSVLTMKGPSVVVLASRRFEDWE